MFDKIIFYACQNLKYMNSTVQRDSIFQMILAKVIAVVPVLRVIKFLPAMPVTAYYAMWVLFAIYSLFFIKIQKVNYVLLSFLLIVFISILYNYPYIHPSYKVEFRFLSFCLIVLSIGPLFDSYVLYKMRRSIAYKVLNILVAVSVVSFLLFCVAPSLSLVRTLYGGILNHSMVMSPVAGLSTLYMIHTTAFGWRYMNTIRKVGAIAIISVCFCSCVLAGSRTALFALVISFLVWMRIYLKNDIFSFLRALILAAFLLVITSPVWWRYTEAVQLKIEYSEKKQGGIIGSRKGMWTKRIDEFLMNPVFGCGFATVLGKVNKDGLVEPGNGWLFVLSSCGFIAFSLFLYFYIYSVKKLYNKGTPESLLILSILVFLAIHLNGEGYTLSSGSLLFFLLWMFLGYSFSLNNNMETPEN